MYPVGAAAVIPGRRSRARLARLRLAARGRMGASGTVLIERGVRIAVAPGARVLLEDGCLLGAGCRIDARGGTVRIGAGARLGERSVLSAHAGIDIGAGAVLGAWVLVADAEPTYGDPDRPTRLQPLHSASVRIGDRARIGTHAALQAGATVAPGAVVEAYEVLTAPRRSA